MPLPAACSRGNFFPSARPIAILTVLLLSVVLQSYALQHHAVDNFGVHVAPSVDSLSLLPFAAEPYASLAAGLMTMQEVKEVYSTLMILRENAQAYMRLPIAKNRAMFNTPQGIHVFDRQFGTLLSATPSRVLIEAPISAKTATAIIQGQEAAVGGSRHQSAITITQGHHVSASASSDLSSRLALFSHSHSSQHVFTLNVLLPANHDTPLVFSGLSLHASAGRLVIRRGTVIFRNCFIGPRSIFLEPAQGSLISIAADDSSHVSLGAVVGCDLPSVKVTMSLALGGCADDDGGKTVQHSNPTIWGVHGAGMGSRESLLERASSLGWIKDGVVEKQQDSHVQVGQPSISLPTWAATLTNDTVLQSQKYHVETIILNVHTVKAADRSGSAASSN